MHSKRRPQRDSIAPLSDELHMYCTELRFSILVSGAISSVHNQPHSRPNLGNLLSFLAVLGPVLVLSWRALWVKKLTPRFLALAFRRRVRRRCREDSVKQAIETGTLISVPRTEHGNRPRRPSKSQERGNALAG
ncbi:hypothetical protein L209DRAFT_751927 [Thermothelomyces heterothallicus CBS 203.75]